MERPTFSMSEYAKIRAIASCLTILAKQGEDEYKHLTIDDHIGLLGNIISLAFELETLVSKKK